MNAAPTDEWFDLVNEDGEVVGSITRREAHGNPTLLHPVVHCVIVNRAGDLLLQRRSKDKDIQPGKWDTSVGGHVGRGEAVQDALVREVGEEVGLTITPGQARFLYRYVMQSAVERELVHTFTMVHEGPFRAQESEVDELRFWRRDEILRALGTGVFTPNFEDEFARFVVMAERQA